MQLASAFAAYVPEPIPSVPPPCQPDSTSAALLLAPLSVSLTTEMIEGTCTIVKSIW